MAVVVVSAHGCCLRWRWRCEGRRGLRGSSSSSSSSSREKLTLQVHVLSVEQLELLLDLSEERVQLAAYLVGEGAAVWLKRRERLCRVRVEMVCRSSPNQVKLPPLIVTATFPPTSMPVQLPPVVDPVTCMYILSFSICYCFLFLFQ